MFAIRKVLCAVRRTALRADLWKCFLGFFLIVAAQVAVAERDPWIATWAASPQAVPPDPDEPLLKIEDQTVRERVRVSVGGAQLRLRLSNEYGSAPLVLGAVTIAVPSGVASVNAASIRKVTFSGHASATIAPGAELLSDPVAFPIAPASEISVSLYFPKRVVSPTLHALALKHAIVSAHGDQTRAERIEGGADTESSILLSAVLVSAKPAEHVLVAFGDSITDGDGSTVDADHNWPSDLVRRLSKMPGGMTLAVVNEGIAGNRLLSDGYGVRALARFDRDALGTPGVTHVVLLEGINDICFPGAKLGGKYLADPKEMRIAEDLIAAYRQLISRAHARGVKIMGATITPFEGVAVTGYYSDSKEAIRQTVNRWIRTSGSFDAVIDFDLILRDPNHPARLLSRFASPDHLHPNDLGYQAMADSINLALFQ